MKEIKYSHFIESALLNRRFVYSDAPKSTPEQQTVTPEATKEQAEKPTEVLDKAKKELQQLVGASIEKTEKLQKLRAKLGSQINIEPFGREEKVLDFAKELSEIEITNPKLLNLINKINSLVKNLKGVSFRMGMNEYALNTTGEKIILLRLNLGIIDFKAIPFKGDWQAELAATLEENMPKIVKEAEAAKEKQKNKLKKPLEGSLGTFLKLDGKVRPWLYSLAPTENELLQVLSDPSLKRFTIRDDYSRSNGIQIMNNAGEKVGEVTIFRNDNWEKELTKILNALTEK